MDRKPLSDAERLDWLRLIRTETVGPITFHRLIARFGTAAAALAALPELARRGGRTRPLRIPSRSEAQRELAALARLGARLIAACEPDYPEPLAALDDAPPLIAVRGHSQLLRRPAVALVGARNASLNGKRFAERLARELGQSGYVVVSGLARGIDAAAHTGALDTGTVAVVAGGVDVVYPEENRELYDRIVELGVVVAETAVGIQPQARHFPRRNRLISGLSLGVVVIEASPNSGSLITANLANDQGRLVFAVPGSPLDPRSQGANALIKKGAILVTRADDVLEALAGMTRKPLGEPPGDRFRDRPGGEVVPQLSEAELARAHTLILESLSHSPVPVDELIRGCQLSASVVRSVLLELEVAGRVELQPGNHVVRIA